MLKDCGRNVLLDSTGWMTLTSWRNNYEKLTSGNAYTFNPLVIKEYGKKYLTTTKFTSITPFSNIPVTANAI